MLYSFPYYDDPPAPQEPPQTYTPLSPPRSRHNLPPSSRLTPQNAPPHPQTWATSTPDETDSKPKTRERASSHSPGSEPCLVRSNGANANLFPAATPPCLGRRRTLSAVSVSHRRDSVDVDARSIISSLLDAYCHSDDAWDDGASGVYSDEMASLASPSSSVCNHRRRRGSNSTIIASEFPTRRTNPPSLLIETSPQWDTSGSAPQTSPVTKNSRPLPSPPSPYASQCHSARPLPHPPLPPPYTLTIDNNVASASDIRPVLSSSPRPSAHAYSPSSSSSSSVPSSSSSTESLGLSCASDQPMLSKFRSLPFLKIPPSPPSQQSSPLSSDIPVPPSPMTARRHQASKLSRILGEDISPEFLGPNRVSRLPPPPSNVSAPSTVNQRQPSCKIKKMLSLPTARRTKSRAVRPNAIYVHDDTTSEESNIGNGRKEEDDREKVSFLDFTDDEDSIIGQGGGGIKIDLLTEDEDDAASSVSDVSEILSPSDSVLEEIEDMEDARIGWALQNVITYQKAARVKRTSRMWVLEKNGQRWEEEDHMNVRQALRQL